MNKIISFGDLHFSSIQQWSYEAGEHFIKWFEEKDFGPKEELEFLFAGDIGQKDVNPGKVIDQMDRLFNSASAKAKWVHIVVGNHDRKLYHKQDQHSLIFLENKGNITVYEKEEIVNSKNNFRMLILPFQRADDVVPYTLHDYYTNYIQKIEDKKFDLVAGHWQVKESESGWAADGVDISPLTEVGCWSLGHIHTRDRKEYLGSIFPNNKDEQKTKFKRCYKEYNEQGQCVEFPLPEFLHYSEIKYGDPVPEPIENCAMVYTILNVGNETLAKEKYPNIYIRGIEKKIRADFDEITSDEEIEDSFKVNLKESFSNMVKETGMRIDRNTYKLCTDLLED